MIDLTVQKAALEREKKLIELGAKDKEGKLTADEKKLFIKQVEVFAAYAAYNDHEIGRVIEAFEDVGRLDNTLVIYIVGDNGSSAEGQEGSISELLAQNGIPNTIEQQLAARIDLLVRRRR